MDLRSCSHELHRGEEYQLAFTHDLCASCESQGGCPFTGTTYQCRAVPVLEGDIQPGSPEAHFWSQQLDGLDIRAEGSFADPLLPGALPQVAVQRAAGWATRGHAWIALPLADLLRARGSGFRSKEEVMESTGMDRRIRTVVVMTGADELLSTLGTAPSTLVPAIKASGHDLILAPSFSVWDDYSPYYNRIQLAYIDRFGTALAEAGIPTVPAVCWYETADLHDFAAAVNANPSIQTMWIDWQTVPPGRKWRRVLRNLDEFASLVPHVRFVINGVRERRQDLWDRDYVMSVISFHEFMSAVRQHRGVEASQAVRQSVQSFIDEGDTWRPTARPRISPLGGMRHRPSLVG